MAYRHTDLTLAPWVVPGRPDARTGRRGGTTLGGGAR